MKTKCAGHKRNGEPCQRPPVAGAKVCRSHGAAAPQVKAMAAVRAEVMRWGLGNSDIDPAETLLRLLSQSVARAERYAAELEDLVGESKNLREALVAQAWGEFGPTGEYVRGLATLEAQERDRAAGFAARAVAAGLAERQVKLAERQGALIADLLRSVLNDPALGLTDEQRRLAPGVARRHLAAAS
jgi:hypothetical protein